MRCGVSVSRGLRMQNGLFRPILLPNIFAICHLKMQLGNDWAVGMLARGGWWSREVRETWLTPGSSFWKGGGERIYLQRELTSNELYGSGWRPQKEGRKQGIRELTDMRNAMRPEVPPPLSTTRPPSGSWGRKEAQVTRAQLRKNHTFLSPLSMTEEDRTTQSSPHHKTEQNMGCVR